MEQRKFHGVLSLFLACLSVLVALVAAARASAALALLYACIVAAGSSILIYCFCGKCPCRKAGCGHVLPGMIASALPARRQGPYGFLDFFCAAFSASIIVLFPQVFLLKDPILFAVYWIIMLSCLFEIRLFVCRGCHNVNCPGRSDKKH
jgi:hypothetical protein